VAPNTTKNQRIDDIELVHEDRGMGVPLLLVHGFPLDHSMWAAQIEALAPVCRVIVPDLRGFGRSGRAPGVSPGMASPRFADHPRADARGSPLQVSVSMEQLADDLAALLDALGIAEPIVLCGLSMGGYVAFQFCRKYAARLRGLVLCDTRAAADTPEVAAGRLVMADRVLREGPAPLVETMIPRLFSTETAQQRPEVVAALRNVMMSNDPRGIAAAARGMAERPDSTPMLGEIRCPTLVLVGQHDALSTPAEMRTIAAAIPRSQFVEIAAAGHMSPLENPEAVTAALKDFLARLA
jgi:pimeloyl-ACP methyl ester carboxylesterase